MYIRSFHNYCFISLIIINIFFFVACIDVIDGTHISTLLPTIKQTSFRSRKIVITQNVMCACDFDMMFTFVYGGWEGTTNDA